MEVKIIKVTDKGQISLPISIRDSLNIEQGDELLITRNNDAIIIKKLRYDPILAIQGEENRENVHLLQILRSFYSFFLKYRNSRA